MTNPDWQDMNGRHAVDTRGDKIGKIGQIYLNDATGSPQWVTISTGLFGNKESFAPIAGYRIDGDDVVLNVTKDQVKGAPNVDADGHLDDAENDRLYAHYDRSLTDESAGQIGDANPSHGNVSNGGGDADVASAAVGDETTTPTSNTAMTLSEERITVGTEQVENVRVRLHKYIVTENVTVTVPVSHEEVRLEHEPFTEVNRGAATGNGITEPEHDATMPAEHASAQKDTVAGERVDSAPAR